MTENMKYLISEVEFTYRSGQLNIARELCASGDGDFFGSTIDEFEKLSGDREKICRLTIERVIQETLIPTPIPEDDILIKKPPHVLDFYETLNDELVNTASAESALIRLETALKPYLYPETIKNRQSYGIPITSSGKNNYIFDLAEAADMGASYQTMVVLKHMQAQGTSTVPDQAESKIDPRTDRSPERRKQVNETFEQCIRAANEIAITQKLPENHTLTMDQCHDAGIELAAFKIDDLKGQTASLGVAAGSILRNKADILR